MSAGLSGGALAAIGIGAGSIIGGYLSGEAGKDAAATAANAQTSAANASIGEQRRQFDAIQKLLEPYVQGGTAAVGSQQDLLGLNGADAQQAAINSLQNGPQFTAMVNQGENALLQKASATGGLRGGNTEAALATFRPQMLSQLIDAQFSKLGSLSSLGQASAAGQAALGQQTGNNISNLLGQIGSAQAGSALASGQATVNQHNSLFNGLGQIAGGVIGNRFNWGNTQPIGTDMTDARNS